MRLIHLMRSSASEALPLTLLGPPRRVEDLSRRIAIYDDTGGFLAPWYFRLRASEEWLRSNRNGRPVSLVVIEPDRNEKESLESWVTGSLRSTDLVCRHEDGRYFLLLLESDGNAASELIKRIGRTVRIASIRTALFPADEERFVSSIATLEEPWRFDLREVPDSP